jgi:hypothetical protein
LLNSAYAVAFVPLLVALLAARTALMKWRLCRFVWHCLPRDVSFDAVSIDLRVENIL